MRRAVIAVCNQISIVFVVSGTNIDLSGLVSNKMTISASEKNSPHTIYPPFYKIIFIDDLIPFECLDEMKKNPNLYSIVKDRDPFKLFYHGRSLWASLLTYSTNKEEVLKLAESKLIFGHEWSKIDEKDKHLAVFALLSSRTTVCVNYEVFEGSKLVAQHMSTLFFIDPERLFCSFKYFSEPILAAGKFKFLI